MTQNEMILQHLEQNGSITPQEAMSKYRCMRLGARVYDLKRMGHRITSERVSYINGYGERKYFARYRMVNHDE